MEGLLSTPKFEHRRAEPADQHGAPLFIGVESLRASWGKQYGKQLPKKLGEHRLDHDALIWAYEWSRPKICLQISGQKILDFQNPTGIPVWKVTTRRNRSYKKIPKVKSPGQFIYLLIEVLDADDLLSASFSRGRKLFD